MNHLYFSTRWVLPKSLARPEDGVRLPPCILCLAPHGVLPLGISAALHKVFGGRAARFGAAPVLFRIPGIQGMLASFGVYPAGKGGILRCLAGGDHAALVVDGIAGMFHGSCDARRDQELYLMRRKAVCKIALEARCPIIPAYCFGTVGMWTVVDPLGGLLRWLSTRLDVALAPFFGRFWLPFGPPARVPLAFCFGDPIDCSDGLPPADASPGTLQRAVDLKHGELVGAFRLLYDTHKGAYGAPSSRLAFV